jgi:hypothetical protein
MAKRASIKGRGADIFFGEYPPDAPAVEDPTSTAQEEAPDTPVAHEPPTTPSTPKSPSDTAPAVIPDVTPGLRHDEILAAIWQHVADPAMVNSTFRFSSRELSWLEDAVYEISKRYGVKVSKQDLIRLGLHILQWDYEQHGETSVLGAFATKRQRQRRGED